jgi:predicted transcriptional regulator
MLVPDAGRRLRPEERAAIERGLAEAEAEELITLEEIEREFRRG